MMDHSTPSCDYYGLQSVSRHIGTEGLLSALKKKTEELALFNEVMVDREGRVIELKEEVNRLASLLGIAPPYPPVWEADLSLDVEGDEPSSVE